MEHNTNLFTDAQFLAIPAINFFGLPGYQQDEPPQMPQRFYEDGRQAFVSRQAARRQQHVGGIRQAEVVCVHACRQILASPSEVS